MLKILNTSSFEIMILNYVKLHKKNTFLYLSCVLVSECLSKDVQKHLVDDLGANGWREVGSGEWVG